MAVQPRNATLAGLAKGFPSANQASVGLADAQRSTGLQDSVAAAQPSQLTTQATQQAGAQQASGMAADRAAVAKVANQQSAQLGRLALGNQALDDQKSLASRQLGLAAKQRDAVNQLAQLDGRLKQELHDKQLAFQQDELGRSLFNERQLLDWKLVSAQKEEDWMSFEQEVRQLSSRKQQMLQMSYEKIKQALAQSDASRNQELDQETKRRLVEAKIALEEKMAKEKAKAANRAGMFQAVGTIAGAAAGSFAGGPAGAMVGAQAGGAVGGLVASQTDV